MAENEKLKNININNCSCYDLDNLPDINDIISENVKIDKKLYKDNYVYYIRYETFKAVKQLYITFHRINGIIEKS